MTTSETSRPEEAADVAARVTEAEAAADFAGLLARVAAGETLVITRDGAPIARISPPESRTMTPAQAVDEFMAVRRNVTLGGLSIRELIEEGRRY